MQRAAPAFQRLMDWVSRPNRPISTIWSSMGPDGSCILINQFWLGLQENEYLGYTIGRGCVKPQTRKVEAMQDVGRTFVRLTSSNLKFIPHFASLASPLKELTRDRLPARVTLTEETEKAFKNLKGALCSGKYL